MTSNMLNEKLILVVGGSGGLGADLVAGLKERGAEVIIAGRSAEGSNAVRLDVTDQKSVQAGIDAIIQDKGRIDGLVNAAGITASAPFEDVELEDFERVIRTNLTGAFILSQVVARAMIRIGIAGSIVNVASLCSLAGCQSVAAYSASKSGVLGLTRTMALDLAKYGIRANTVVPGMFLTDLNRSRIGGTKRGASVLNRTPAGRFGEPSELVGAVSLLLSDDARFINGTEIIVDGGFLAAGIFEGRQP